MDIQIIEGYDHPRQVGILFNEYTASLIEGDPEFRKYLEIQNYDEELKHLEAKYGKPEGSLYMLLVDGEPAGCIAMRKIDDENREMKRLYVRSSYRGLHLGEKLARKVIRDAKAYEYRHMLLDTLPFLEAALMLYKKLGFYEIPSYNDSPMDTSIYMKLDL